MKAIVMFKVDGIFSDNFVKWLGTGVEIYMFIKCPTIEIRIENGK